MLVMKHGVAERPEYIWFLKMEGIRNMRRERTSLLSDMRKARKYGELRSRGAGIVEGAGVHEEKRDDDKAE